MLDADDSTSAPPGLSERLVCPCCGRQGSRLGEACEEHLRFLVPADAAAAAPANSLLGEMLAERYIVLGVLGSGAVGTVYWGVQHPVGRRVAVKVLHAGITASAEDKERFEREARAIASLNHPHVVTCYDSGFTAAGLAYMALEFLQGSSLERVLQSGLLEPEQVAYIARQILEGVAALHDAGLIHRDLKPANLMLCQVGRNAAFLKVIDFGLVKGRGAEGQEQLTQAGHILGTPVYMAPEQALGRREVTAATDVYALGCILYELVMGAAPFDGRNVMDILLSHVQRPVPPMEGARAEAFDPAFLELIRRCLAKEPQDRFANAVEALQAFRLLDLREGDPDSAGRLRSLLLTQAADLAASTPPSTRLLKAPHGSLRVEVDESFLVQRRSHLLPIQGLAPAPTGGLAAQWAALIWTTAQTVARLMWTTLASLPIWGWLASTGRAEGVAAVIWLDPRAPALARALRGPLETWGDVTAIPLGLWIGVLVRLGRALRWAGRALAGAWRGAKEHTRALIAKARQADRGRVERFVERHAWLSVPLGLLGVALDATRAAAKRGWRRANAARRGVWAVHEALGRRLVWGLDQATEGRGGAAPWRQLRGGVAPMAGRLLLLGNLAFVALPLLALLIWLE